MHSVFEHLYAQVQEERKRVRTLSQAERYEARTRFSRTLHAEGRKLGATVSCIARALMQAWPLKSHSTKR